MICINILNITLLKKTLLISLCTCFLFSHYNQRYLLTDKFLNYIKLFKSNNNVILHITKKLLPIEIIHCIICLIFINKFSLQSLLYIFIGIMLFLLNILINSLIYHRGLKLKYSNRDKDDIISKISGGLYIIQFLILFFI
ncbi:hypothetical protein F502_17472 [Clostridium pasteurianum DSM 525 = ATCC 6013]|nr:hypothetical protein F502_17472 [Clostridium pasteurianum DSM 525 = ATCC 6013]